MPPWYLTDISLWVITTIIGLIGFVLAVRGLIGDRARGRPTCFKCRYDMSTLESLACPECGHVHALRKHLFKTRRYYRRFILGTLLLLMALHCHTGPEVQYRREQLGEKWWESIVPTTVWIVMLPYLEDERVDFLDDRVRRPEPTNPNAPSPAYLFAASFRGDDEPLDELFHASTSSAIWSGSLSDWQCRLLANAVRRRLERIPYTPPSPTLGLPPRAQPREIAADWVSHMRAQVNVLEDLIALSSDGDPAVRRKALLALRDETRIDKVRPVLLAALDDSDTTVRLAATQVLGRFGPKASAAVPALLTAISHPSNNTNVDVGTVTNIFWIDHNEPLRAIMALALLRIDVAMGLPIIMDDMSFSSEVYQSALGILVRSQVDPATFWPLAIFRSLVDDDEDFQQFIEIEIDPTKPMHERAGRSLMRALVSDSLEKRVTARRLIEQMGVGQVPLMHWAAWHDDIDITEEFVGLMITLGDKANSLTHPVARKMLRDPARYRGQIMDMLAHTGPPSKEVIAVLRDATNHEDEAVREMAKFTLEQIQP